MVFTLLIRSPHYRDTQHILLHTIERGSGLISVVEMYVD